MASLSPEAWGAIISGGANFAGNMLQNNANRQMTAADRRMTIGRDLSQTADTESNDQLRRAQASLNATQMDPYRQQKDLFKAKMLAQLASSGAPQMGSAPMSFSAAGTAALNDNALADAAMRFYSNVGQINPAAITPQLSTMGFGDAAYQGGDLSRQAQLDRTVDESATYLDQLNRRRRDDLLNTLQTQDGAPAEGGRSGRPWWQTALGIGAMAVPFLGMPAMAATALTAGAGATSAFGGRGGGAASGGAAPGFAPGSDYFSRRRG